MRKIFALALVVVMALSAVSFAAEWPSGTVNVVLPYGAGGDTDTYCRQLFQRVSKITGQTFVVINQQGGSGIVAAMDVITSPMTATRYCSTTQARHSFRKLREW